MKTMKLQLTDFDKYLARKDTKDIHWVRFDIDEFTKPFMYHLDNVEKLIYFELVFLICSKKNEDVDVDFVAIARKLSTSVESVSYCVEKLIHHKVLKLLKKSPYKSVRICTDSYGSVLHTDIHTDKQTNTHPNVASGSNLKEVFNTREELELVYQGYPRKEGKSGGMKVLEKEIKTKEELELLKKAIANYSELTWSTEKKYIKHFETFSRCWRDYLQVEPQNDRSSKNDEIVNRLLKKGTENVQ